MDLTKVDVDGAVREADATVLAAVTAMKSIT
jgi:hypothetical protein